MSIVPESGSPPAGEVLRGADRAALGPAAPRPSTESFEDFYRRAYPGLLVLAKALVGPSAEDVAQEAMLVAYRRWHDVATMASPIGWVRGVCTHQALSRLRRASLERRLLRRTTFTNPVVAVADEVAGAEHFWSLVRRLPARQAEAVALRFAVDLPVLEVADAMGCTEGTVKAHLARAKASLAELVATTEGQRP